MKSLSLGFRKLRVVDIVVLGIFMSLLLILGRFTVGVQSWRLSFGFVVTAIASMLYGPLWSSTIAALTDIIGTLMSGSVYFPGFTISAILGAAIYGYFFYGKEITWKRVIIAQLIIAVVVNAILNTYWLTILYKTWLTILYKTPFWAFLPVRALKELVMTPIQMAILYYMLNSQTMSNIQSRLFK
ncbi:folate family ECF transporter S component [Lentilactobacillus buchneri]|nr:folate family ECF transporter S component [Lentilactobacillus sp. Egmn17]